VRRTWIIRLSALVLASFLAGSAATGVGPAAAAGAAAALRDHGSKPLEQQWWFDSWEVVTRDWPISQGAGITVAVLDTGVQADLPDLAGAVLSGTDLAGGDGRTDVDAAIVPGHGTSMAALIVAQGTHTRFLGVAPEAKVLPVVVNTGHSDPVSEESDGIRYAVDHHAAVINISQGSPAKCPDTVQKAVSYAIAHDVVVVAGAGNGDFGGGTSFPANCAGVLAVGAVTVADGQFIAAPNTQHQPYVAVGAPGGVGAPGLLRDGQIHTSSSASTSTASALTSGVAALLRAQHPDMPAREVVQRIIASCLDVAPAGKDLDTGYGLIRPNHALQDDVAKDSPNPVFDAYDAWAAKQRTSTEATAPPAAHSQFPVGLALLWVGVLLVIVVIGWLVRRRDGRRG
jgi:subtilisin family serine protease